MEDHINELYYNTFKEPLEDITARAMQEHLPIVLQNMFQLQDIETNQYIDMDMIPKEVYIDEEFVKKYALTNIYGLFENQDYWDMFVNVYRNDAIAIEVGNRIATELLHASRLENATNVVINKLREAMNYGDIITFGDLLRYIHTSSMALKEELIQHTPEVRDVLVKSYYTILDHTRYRTAWIIDNRSGGKVFSHTTGDCIMYALKNEPFGTSIYIPNGKLFMDSTQGTVRYDIEKDETKEEENDEGRSEEEDNSSD